MFVGSIDPKLEILPEPQKMLWPQLTTTPNHFILYGGTAIALRLGHRVSIDFDFFSSQTVDPDQLVQILVPYRPQSKKTYYNNVSKLICQIFPRFRSWGLSDEG